MASSYNLNKVQLNIPTPLRTRLAPTPSGLLHPGNGLNFILTSAIARAKGGNILLRIDDLDKARCRKVYVEDTFRTLDWLGLDYDEGPQGVDDFFKNWSQHTRLEEYARALDKLRGAEQLFACTCSRKDVRDRSPDGRYPDTCLHRSRDFEAPQTAWRVKAPVHKLSISVKNLAEGPHEAGLDILDAFVVRQKNKLPAYQLASLVDDVLFDINCVVRGADLWESTLAQIYLARLLEFRTFTDAAFWHHPLIKDEKGEKLSKSKGAGSLKEWREAGRPATDLFRQAGIQLGVKEECRDLRSLIDQLK